MRTGLILAPFLAVLGASLIAHADDGGCAKLAVAGLLPGMSADEVHAALRGTGDTSKVGVFNEGKRASVEEYALPEGTVHVEYDGVPSRNGQHVVLVRQAVPQSYDSVTTLLKRLGGPSAGRDALVQGLQPGPAVWVDRACDVVF